MSRKMRVAMMIAALLGLYSWASTEEPIETRSTAAVQDTVEAKVYPVPEIIVTATRSRKHTSEVPNTIHVLAAADLRTRRLPRTLPEALKETPGVMVQKTSHGQGSPYIRGFTGFRTLFLIDGIRLNNSVFREGPNQYWNTVDPMMIDRLDVVKGPGSVLYGSDAIGGTVNAITQGHAEYRGESAGYRRLYYRYSSAEQAHVGRAEIHRVLGDRVSFLLGGSFKDYGDLRAGGDIGVQRKTGYHEWDGDLKLNYLLGPDSRLMFAHQQANLDDAWRTHKTIHGISWNGTAIGSEKKRILDQSRNLTYLQYHGGNLGSLIDGVKASLSYHHQEEEQVRIKSDDTGDRQGFTVGTLGAGLQFESWSPVGGWVYGLEYYRDAVDSFKKKYNADGSLKGMEIQGPVADDATYDLLDVYVQNDLPIRERFELLLGGRYTYAEADAGKVKDPVTGTPIALSEQWAAVVGSARFLYRPGSRWSLFAGVSQGFRAPNLSDLTRLDTARTDEIETAAPGLDPERFVSYEIGGRVTRNRGSGEWAYFYTDIHDMIVRTPTGRIIDGDHEVTKKNAGDGFAHGVELSARYLVHPRFTAFGSFTWVDGGVDTYPTSSPEPSREPTDRLMPSTGHFGLRWDHPEQRYWIEGLCTAASMQDKLSTRDRSDTQRIPPGGTPGYTVFGLRSGWRINSSRTLSVALENITDEAYRIHGSGQNEAGANLIVGLDWTF